MAITDLSVFAALRTRMQWHQERQKILAENVANAETPKFRPRDLGPPDLSRSAGLGSAMTLGTTSAAHFGSIAAASAGSTSVGGYEIRPSGNAVMLEDEMMKVASNQMDYQTVTSLYARSLGLLKTALGKR